MASGGSGPDDAETRDERRVNTFGSRGEYNHIHLRQIFPELSIDQALQFLVMVVDDPRDPHITDEDMAEVVKLTAASLLCDLVNMQDADWYLDKADGDSFKAYQHAKERIEAIKKIQAANETAKAKFVETFITVTGATIELASHLGKKYGYENLETAIQAYYGDDSTDELAESSSTVDLKDRMIWMSKFMKLTAATEDQAQYYGRRLGYNEQSLENAIQTFLATEDAEPTCANRSDTGWGPVSRFLPDPFYDLDDGIEGNDFSLLSRWTRTPLSEQIRQLDLSHRFNSFDAFRWMVATRTMAKRHEKYIKKSWATYSKGGKAGAESIVNHHIRQHNIDAYEDIAKAGGMKCDRAEAKRHLRWSEDFGVAMRYGFQVEQLTEEQEAGIRKLNALRTTWRLRLTRLTRLRDLLVRHGYPRLRRFLEPGWDTDTAAAQDVIWGFAPAGSNVDGDKEVEEEEDAAAAAPDVDDLLAQLTVQDSYNLGSGTSAGIRDSFEATEESDDEVWDETKEFGAEEVVKKGEIRKEVAEEEEEKLVDLD